MLKTACFVFYNELNSKNVLDLCVKFLKRKDKLDNFPCIIDKNDSSRLIG